MPALYLCCFCRGQSTCCGGVTAGRCCWLWPKPGEQPELLSRFVSPPPTPTFCADTDLAAIPRSDRNRTTFYAAILYTRILPPHTRLRPGITTTHARAPPRGTLPHFAAHGVLPTQPSNARMDVVLFGPHSPATPTAFTAHLPACPPPRFGERHISDVNYYLCITRHNNVAVCCSSAHNYPFTCPAGSRRTLPASVLQPRYSAYPAHLRAAPAPNTFTPNYHDRLWTSRTGRLGGGVD